MEKSLQSLGKNQRMEEWAQRVSDCRSSGLTVRNWCEQHGINEKTYYYWQRRIWETMNESRSSRFVQIPVEAASAGQTAAVRIRINGAEAEIRAGTDAATIEAVCRALREC
jgi:P2-related tail formation protein